MRHLIVVLGDQLDLGSPVLTQGSAESDLIWMAEVAEESTKVWSHKARIALFLTAMRHFAEALREAGWRVDYRALDCDGHQDLGNALRAAITRHAPSRVRMVAAGEWAVARQIEQACAEAGASLEVLEDTHFLTTAADFDEWRAGRKQWVMEHFYRFARRRSGDLMTGDGAVGGQWNLDRHNRRRFSKQGPGAVPVPVSFAPDALTREVLGCVERRFAGHPGGLGHFAWPVTRAQARAALEDFVTHRLPTFGPYQDAMWTGEPWLYHSRLSASLNLKLLRPREVLNAVGAAFDAGQVPLNSAEGYVRQVLGWREYVRHVYWTRMPALLNENALGARQPLPTCYWTGETEMACLRETLTQTLDYGYAHHIQRLMVTGLFALLLGVEPRQVHEWYLAVYVDAVEWVEAPNTLGMSQYADGGRLASKPYVASGRYIQRMSNYCRSCRFDAGSAEGEKACPFTLFYWDFLIRHAGRFARHPRTALQWRQRERLDAAAQQRIRRRAELLRERLAKETANASGVRYRYS